LARPPDASKRRSGYKTFVASGDFRISKNIDDLQEYTAELLEQPTITALGIYRASHLDNELRQQLHQFYFFGNASRDRSSIVHEFINRCIPLVLFEALLDRLDERFSIDDFTQEMPEVPPKAWQSAYDEAVLSSDGWQLLVRKPRCTRGLKSGRIAFYFHFYDPYQPMRWSYGTFATPPVADIPERLRILMPYSAVD
jgi:hypothetical protein